MAHTQYELIKAWRTLVAGDEQLHWPCGKPTWELIHSQLKQIIIIFMDCVAYRWGRYGCSSPSTIALHDLGILKPYLSP